MDRRRTAPGGQIAPGTTPATSTEPADRRWRSEVKTQVALHLITHAVEALQDPDAPYDCIIEDLLRIKDRVLATRRMS